MYALPSGREIRGAKWNARDVGDVSLRWEQAATVLRNTTNDLSCHQTTKSARDASSSRGTVHPKAGSARTSRHSDRDKSWIKHLNPGISINSSFSEDSSGGGGATGKQWTRPVGNTAGDFWRRRRSHLRR